MMRQLLATPETVHWGYFSKDLAPVMEVSPGDVVEVETFSYPRGESLAELLTERLEDILRQVSDVGPGPHLLTGPIYVEGARPGDVLAVRIRAVEPLMPYGYNRIRAGMGLLPEDFPVGRLKVIPIDIHRRRITLIDNVEIPMRPFFGILGVAPAGEGRWDSRIPGPFGGNIDITELSAGSTLYLPVFVPGGLFSVGDGHAVQGDGEVDLSALETSMRGELEFGIRRDLSLDRPMVETATHMITTGFDEDLDEAVKMATRGMIRWLSDQHRIDPMDAYTLCSLAVDLRVSQVVNGRKGIHAMLSKAVLKPTGM